MPDAEEDEEPTCPNCGGPLHWERCHAINCDVGYVFYEHDFEPCSTCAPSEGWLPALRGDGYGGFYSCPHCDLTFYANTV